jgi:hypothetical protein
MAKDGRVYLAVHTKGYDSTDDLCILVGRESTAGALIAMADRMSAINGKRWLASHRWAWGMATHSPHLFYGYDFDMDAMLVAARIRLFESRCARDIDADVHTLCTSEWDRV